MSLTKFARVVYCTAIALVLIPAAQASLIPDGSPRHNGGAADAKLGSATSTAGQTVRLVPNPAVFMPQGSCPWLLPALNAKAQPYNNATNVWNYSFSALNADLTLNSYEAWADNSPTLTLNGNSFSYGKQPGRGGAGFELTYAPTAAQIKAGAPDPSKTTIYWVQVIDSNMPSPRGVTYGVPSPANDGTTVYMDNEAPGTKNQAGIDPYYGRLTGFDTANGFGFVDLTSVNLASSVGLTWEAQVFPATETTTFDAKTGVTTHNVTIYDGAWWGFHVAPEPSTWVLLVMGGGWLLVVCRKKLRPGNGPGHG
jgi:hypothetical protein